MSTKKSLKTSLSLDQSRVEVGSAEGSDFKFEYNIPLPSKNKRGRPRSLLTVVVSELMRQEVGASVRLPDGYSGGQACARACSLGFRGALAARSIEGDDPHIRVWKVKNVKGRG